MVIWLSLQIHVGIISNVINTIGVNVIAPTFHGLAPILSWFWYNLSKRKKEASSVRREEILVPRYLKTLTCLWIMTHVIKNIFRTIWTRYKLMLLKIKCDIWPMYENRRSERKLHGETRCPWATLHTWATWGMVKSA